MYLLLVAWSSIVNEMTYFITTTPHHLGPGIVLIILFLQMSDSYLDIKRPTNHIATSLVLWRQERVLWAWYFADNYQNYNICLITNYCCSGCWKVKTHQQRQQQRSEIVRSMPGVQSVSQSVSLSSLLTELKRKDKMRSVARGLCSAVQWTPSVYIQLRESVAPEIVFT